MRSRLVVVRCARPLLRKWRTGGTSASASSVGRRGGALQVSPVKRRWRTRHSRERHRFFFQLPSLPTAYYTPTWSSDKIQKFSRPVSKDQNVSWPPYLTVLIGEGRHTPRWPVEPITTEFRSQLTSIFPFLYAFELLLLSLHTRLQSHVPSEPSVTLSSYLQPAASRCTYWRYCIVVPADATAHSSSDLGEERQVTCQQQL